ncbi:MAG: Mu transposase C-terminal domain-containing protein [Eubacteriales bacterium]|nr:Mu transposase C-terminal domain-containing protein [Eubacteriales bacterium]
MLIKKGELTAVENNNPSNNRKEYLFKLEDLPEGLQKKYLKQEELFLPEAKDSANYGKGLTAEKRKFSDFNDREREEIREWIEILKQWQTERAMYHNKGEADKNIIAAINHELFNKGSNIIVSSPILYRKFFFYRNGDYEGLLDRRGGWNKGNSSVPPKVWDAFLFYYLDERQPALARVYKDTIQWTKEFYPHLLEVMPSERTFRRKLEKEVPSAVQTFMRKGAKALDDDCLPYIERAYDELQVNDVWVTDNHTLDIISKYEDGKEGEHRMHLTAFWDAKSGILTGWNITNNPSINSTLFALRHGIKRCGVPKMIYADNGSEFMSYDFATRGKRKTKEENEIDYALTILGRMGIEIKTAKVKNARAKPVERFFLSFKEHISKLFSTYTGGNITERPESLKSQLKKGNIPVDSKLRDDLSLLIEKENCELYGGAEKRKYKGMTKMEVFNEGLKEIKQVIMTDDDLDLFLLRGKKQKVGRKGVYVEIAKEKIYFMANDTWMHFGKEVLVRYDPTDLSSVRIYDMADRYMATWEVERTLLLNFLENDAERLAEANEKLANIRKSVKQYKKDMFANMRADTKIDILDLQIRKAHMLTEGTLIEQSNLVEVRRYEEKHLHQATGTDNAVVIDIEKMNRNGERRKGR